MERFRNHAGFEACRLGETYEQVRKGLLVFRQEAPSYVYWKGSDDEEILVGYGLAPFEVEMPAGHFTVASTDRVWISHMGVSQLTVATSDEVFTTLDRPAPLSPEMAAIQRLIRQNSIEREEIRERMMDVQRANAELRNKRSGGSDRVDVEADPAVTEESGGPTKRGKKQSPQRKGRSTAAAVDHAGDGDAGGEEAGDDGTSD